MSVLSSLFRQLIAVTFTRTTKRTPGGLKVNNEFLISLIIHFNHLVLQSASFSVSAPADLLGRPSHNNRYGNGLNYFNLLALIDHYLGTYSR